MPVNVSLSARACISAPVYPPALPDTQSAAAPVPEVTRKFRRDTPDHPAIASPSRSLFRADYMRSGMVFAGTVPF
jgi:hypothetical protein